MRSVKHDRLYGECGEGKNLSAVIKHEKIVAKAWLTLVVGIGQFLFLAYGN